jgi:cell division protein FtsI/penicillin-binding protein 2
MKRVNFLFFTFTVLLICVIIKLFFIQIVNSSQNSSNSYLKTDKIIPARGNIFDRNNEPIALNETTYQLFVEPKNVEDKDKLISGIDSVLKIGDATLSAKIDMSKVWIPVASGIEKQKKDALLKLSLKGIGFDNENKRFYPEGSLSAHLLGFVGKTKDGEDTGYFGLEGYYQKDLAGIPGIVKSEKDLFGNPIIIGVQDKLDGENGRDLISTIDLNVQRIVKMHLEEGVRKYGAKDGCAIAADPNTMEILALTCLPDFDPTQYYSYDGTVFKNSAISNLYEPGSIFKPLVMAAAINERVIKPDTIYDETGPLTLSGYQIQTWDQKYEGKITMTRALEKSSNVAMVFVGQKLGDKKLLSYISKFGFGKMTNIDLQGEDSGYLKPESSWYPIDYATATFGQGIAVTPIQMIRAFSSIINGGNLMQPMLVSAIKSENGEVNKMKPHVDAKILDERTSDLMKLMLQSTVEHGEIKYPLPDGYHVGGKTGTAQIPIAGHYDASKTVASFVGFAPVDKPKFIILISLKEPSSSIWGSETAEPIFFNIVRDLFVYYNMPAQ